jgi:3-phenylpropionate/trans-cinnamate dioxygenase ferredoxin subunit
MPNEIKVAQASELPPGSCMVVQAGERELALCHAEDGWFALDNACTHVGGPLGDGAIDGKSVVCPWHGAAFDLATGAATSGPARAGVKCYPVRVVGDDVFVDV